MLKICRTFGFAALVAAATTSLALAQPEQTGQAPGGPDPHGHSETATPPGGTRSESGGAQQNMPGQGMMGQEMMGQGMMGGAQRQSGGSPMPMMNMGMGAGAMGMGRAAGMGMPMGRAPMMKMMFAITDADGNGAVSFNEVVEIHKRMFDAVDANNDGGVTPEEIESFFRN